MVKQYIVKEGCGMNTLHDVAKLAGVSAGTVSNVINNSKKVAPKTVERVQNAIKELNYTPNIIAKSLKTNNSRIIGILVEDVSAFSSGDIIDGICEYCENHGYSINLCNLRVNKKVREESEYMYEELEETESFKESIKSNLNILLASRVCGLIYIGTHPRDVGHILPPLSIPVVYTYAYTKKGDYCINYDDYQGAKLAVDYLIANGHERIALICGSVSSVPSHKRMMGYQSSLMEHNLPYNPDYIKTGKWQYIDGYNSCVELLKLKNPPSAIFAMNDLMAVGALNALSEKGYRVPDDFSIHGFDNIEVSEVTNPALTTVALPLHEMGMQSAKTMDAILNENPPDEQGTLIPCSHIVRNTVTPKK